MENCYLPLKKWRFYICSTAAVIIWCCLSIYKMLTHKMKTIVTDTLSIKQVYTAAQEAHINEGEWSVSTVITKEYKGQYSRVMILNHNPVVSRVTDFYMRELQKYGLLRFNNYSRETVSTREHMRAEISTVTHAVL